MPPVLEQTAYNTTPKWQSRTCTATFNKPTKPGSLIVVACASAGTIPSRMTTPAGFTQIANPGLRDIMLNVYYRQAAPSMTSVSITALDDNKSQQIRMFEYSGMAQTNVLDKLVIRSAENRDPHTGDTGNISQADELVMAFVVNQYATTAQYGFHSNLSRLYENVSPQLWWLGWNEDWERSRMSVHQAITTSIDNFYLDCDLSTTRRWMTCLVSFRGGTTGPARFTSTQNPEPMVKTDSFGGSLTAFGPLSSKNAPDTNTAQMKVGDTVSARISPFNYQYRLGGWKGLLIGSGTNYHVQGTENLYGWTIRTSDDDKPRGDGALRGIDLQSAREVIFKMNVGRGRDEVERNMAELYRALVPQRDTDWELIWRHPTGVLKMMRLRPTDVQRSRDKSQLTFQTQQFVLRASDPRHYSAIAKKVDIANTPYGQQPQITQVVNIGNSAAYPIITIEGPPASYGIPVRAIQIANITALVNFEAELVLNPGSILEADMDARITGVPKSIITLDGQTKYGSWQLPREPFRIDPDPTGLGGYNQIYMQTDPPGAPIKATLEYRDTWAG